MMAFRRLSSATDSSATDLGENDDEAEKEERRNRTFSESTKSSNSSISFISNLSPVEIEVQIAQCLKLNAENKINDKNAFQLKMIDFLVYSLKKHDPRISNLQMASACLDASGKIYGYRVDKVHSDLLKIVGGARGDKRPHEDDGDDLGEVDANGNVINRPKKKKRRKCNFISTAEALKGNLESYNPLIMIQHNIDAQTSDHLNQSSLPQHANQGIALNLFNDVLLDRIPLKKYNYSNFLVPRIQDFLHNQLCPSYGAFQFLGWSVDDELMDTNEPSEPSETNTNYHFDMDDPIEEEEEDKRDGIMDYRDQDERFAGRQDQEPINDFQEIIANNPNPDATYEYSYVQNNYSIHLVKPWHWKVNIKRDVRYNGAARPAKKARRKKEIELEFTEEAKEEADTRFVFAKKPTKLLRATYSNWSDNNLTFPHFCEFDSNRFSSYYTKDKIEGDLDALGKVENKIEQERENDEVDDFFNLSGFGIEHQDDPALHLQLDEHENQIAEGSFVFPDSEPPLQPPVQQAFLDENLVALPTLTDKVFIPYSQRAKKIDMRQLTKSIKKVLQDKESQEFSKLYKVLPFVLSKNNAQSLSPGLAFTSLLHVAHENRLFLKNHSNYADLTITNNNKVPE